MYLQNTEINHLHLPKNMKKILIILIMLSIPYCVIYGQDIIVFRTGEEIQVVVKKVGLSSVEYIRYDNKEGPVYEVLKNDIFIIQYQNGTKDYLKIETNNNQSDHTLNEGVFVDPRDSTMYKIIRIGEQVWMAENLKFDTGNSPCFVNEDKPGCDRCGRYYKYDDALIACPEGWHLPSDAEWMVLEIEVGMETKEAGKIGWRGTHPGQSAILKEKGASGLNILLCGQPIQTNFSYKNPKYSNYDLNAEGYYWTSTQDEYYISNSTTALIRLFKGRASIDRSSGLKRAMYSVRCLKDE